MIGILKTPNIQKQAKEVGIAGRRILLFQNKASFEDNPTNPFRKEKRTVKLGRTVLNDMNYL